MGPIRKRITVVALSFAVGCSLAAGCGLDEGGFSVAPDASPGPPPPGAESGVPNPPVDASADGADASSEASVDAGGCAACPARSVCVGNACVIAHRVFVSSTESTADLGGAVGADDKCQALADRKNLGGTWRAWLSDPTTSPSIRFVQASVPYRMLDGTLIADHWNDLTDGALAHGIDRDENGISVNDAEVWTGTSEFGTRASDPGNQCQGFRASGSPGQPATVGIANDRTQWTTRYTQFCNRTNVRIYCFEQ